MFDGVAVGRPRIIVGFEMKTKVGAKPSWNGRAEIEGGGDAGYAPTWCVVMNYKCESCDTNYQANDGRLLLLLPPDVGGAYPVLPR